MRRRLDNDVLDERSKVGSLRRISRRRRPSVMFAEENVTEDMQVDSGRLSTGGKSGASDGGAVEQDVGDEKQEFEKHAVSLLSSSSSSALRESKTMIRARGKRRGACVQKREISAAILGCLCLVLRSTISPTHLSSASTLLPSSPAANHIYLFVNPRALQGRVEGFSRVAEHAGAVCFDAVR